MGGRAVTQDVLIRVAILGLAVYPIVRGGVKPIIRALGTGKRRDSTEAVRAAACWTGAVLALLPGTLPAEYPAVWRVILGVVAGSLSIVLHHAAERAIRMLPERMAQPIADRLLGRGME